MTNFFIFLLPNRPRSLFPHTSSAISRENAIWAMIEPSCSDYFLFIDLVNRPVLNIVRITSVLTRIVLGDTEIPVCSQDQLNKFEGNL